MDDKTKKDVSVGKLENTKTGGDRIRLFVYSFLMFIAILIFIFVILAVGSIGEYKLTSYTIGFLFPILIFLGVGVLIFIWGWKGKKKIKEKINYTIEHKRE